MTAIVPAWTGSRDDEVRDVRHGPAMFSAMTGMPDGLDLLHGLGDLAAHDRAGQHKDVGPGQVRDRAHGVGDLLLADERDRVDADPLAAQVVAVRLGDGAQVHLRDLRPAADDDHALAEDLAEGLARLGLDHAWQPATSVAAAALSKLRVSKSNTRTTSGSPRVAGNVLIATISAPASRSVVSSCEIRVLGDPDADRADGRALAPGSCRSGRSASASRSSHVLLLWPAMGGL